MAILKALISIIVLERKSHRMISGQHTSLERTHNSFPLFQKKCNRDFLGFMIKPISLSSLA